MPRHAKRRSRLQKRPPDDPRCGPFDRARPRGPRLPPRLRPAPQEPGARVRGGLRPARRTSRPLPPLRLPLRRLLRQPRKARPGEAEVVELEGRGATLSLIPAIQKHVAVFAIGPSTVRRQGARGVVAAAQDFLAEVSLRSFARGTEASFRRS